ncbi:unnamed protein product [Rhizophagus irregularis]|uniref:Uncharacterized protein n=1 Tax=Rhizophagus irregularis TaxID=588596 RepID=A0A915YNX4_9GLOM|nr:unnamed protein product [Rhizophagus irregularis]CAB5301857.1 unnamed protein product [Rhizophagus irregularis]
MSSDYRKELIKAGILVYWNRKTASKVHTLYFNHLSRLSTEKSIGQLLLNKILAEIRTSTLTLICYEITEFWKRKEEGSYRKTLDGHTRKEKEYLSSLHLGELQNEDDNNKKEFDAKNDEYEDDKDKDGEDDNDYDEEEDDKDKDDEYEDDKDKDGEDDNDYDEEEDDKDKDDEEEDDKDGDNEDGDGGPSVTMDGKALIDVLVPGEDSKIVERNEPDAIGRTKRWILSSETDVGQVLTTYRYQIPESQKCIDPIYWGILDLTGSHTETKKLFTTEDWNEMLKSFEDEIEVIEEDIPDAVYLFFDEIDEIIKTDGKNEAIVTAIDGISLQELEAKHKITLSERDKAYMIEVKRAVLTYAENLAGVDLPVSESAYDNLFTNMLIRRFLDNTELKMDSGEICSWASAQRRNEGRSITLRARVGQKCDFRGTLKHSINKLEAITGLRSGGLPEPHRKKIFLDSLDLSITMRDILHAFFKSNANSPDEDLHKIFILGVQSWGWTHQVLAMDCKGTNICRYGKLCTTALPNSIRTLACLEKFYIEMKNVKATLHSICNKANDIALSHARAHRRKRKGKDREEHANVDIGGCFGKITGTPTSKKSRTL